jgi:hypothetical protein
LDEQSPSDLLLIYMNWRFRQVHPHRRNVQISDELTTRKRSDDTLFSPHRKEFDKLIGMIIDGEDLTDLLSSRINEKPYQLEPDYASLGKEKHLDLLLNEQGIHHLHLPGLKNKRGSPILFAIFEQSDAFFLDIAAHDDWSTDRLARISYRNWNQRHFRVLPMDGLCDDQGNAISLQDWQRVNVRNNAVNCPIELAAGLFVSPQTGGVAANGFRRQWSGSATLFGIP